MKINYKLISAVLAVGVAYDAYCIAENQKRFNQIRKVMEHSLTLNKLYAKKLADNDIPLDEFEQIIVNDILNKL